MLFKKVGILNKDFELEENMYVAVKGDTIEYIGKERPEGDFGEVIDGKGKLLMPGFYNAHAHSPMALMRGYGENLKLQDWLEKEFSLLKINWIQMQFTGALCCAWRNL